MDVPKDQLSSLLDHGLYSSAQILGSFAVSSSTTNAETSPHLKAESLVLFGDSLFRDKEYKRALNIYGTALQYHGLAPKQSSTTPPTTRSSLAASRSSSPNSFNTSTINEDEVKFKIAMCQNSLGESKLALGQMEKISSKSRNLEMNLMMAKLYRKCRHTRAAVGCFKECVRSCPYVIEAIVALAELGVTAKDIITLFPQTPNRSGRPPFDHFDSGRWLHRYVEAQCCIASNDYKGQAIEDSRQGRRRGLVEEFHHPPKPLWFWLAGGLEIYSELLQRFPNNIHILLEMAKVKAITGKNEEAILDFEKVRSVDPFVITYMDEYAMLLKMKSDNSKLSKLVSDTLRIDPTRPEVFVALSVLWEKKDERGALSHAEKSIHIDERHVAGYIMKGNLSLSMNRPESAVGAFRIAQELRPDIRSYQGLVRAYLVLSKIKEALYVAREAMKAMPQSAKALKLVGDVHASSTTGREKAKKFYESALRLEPGFLAAAMALAELHLMEGRNGDALSLLERYLKDRADDSLHVKLAQVLAATNMLHDALSHYQAALRINPESESAKRGLDRLEKQMKGVDPDAPEEDEDNEVDDADVDQEDDIL